MSYKIKIINNYGDLTIFKDQWDKLYERTGKSVSQSYYFTLQSLKYDIKMNKGIRIHLILFFNENDLICIFPFLKKKNSLYKCIKGSSTGDESDFLISSNSDVRKVVSTFYDFINKNNYKVFIKDLDANSPFLKYFEYYHKKNFFSYIGSEKIEVNIKTSRPFPKKIRNERVRILKKIKQTSTEKTNDIEKETILNLIEEIVNEDSNRKKEYYNEHLIEFLLSGLNQGWLECYSTKLANEIVALNFLIINKHHRLIFIDMYKSIPLLNIGIYYRLIDYIKSESKNNNRIGLGKGLYQYKIKNFNPEITSLVNVVITKNIFFTIYEILKIFLITMVLKFVK
jgi:hypothetical protein